ncbi:transcriptional regulator, partial [Escherichia coli]|nr:transcriptional regulator [Escherichia coli]
GTERIPWEDFPGSHRGNAQMNLDI